MIVHGYQVVIGLEVHAQLLTERKLLCACPNRSDLGPNQATCPVCLGMPGTLPVVNQRAVELAVRAASALGCTVHRRSRFARKSYFYPDLPKGYQITQDDMPLATDGRLRFQVEGQAGERCVTITRLHLEEDAGKSTHVPGTGTLVDFNRCGVPLVEIVGAPEIGSPDEAVAYLKELRTLLRHVGVCDGNMEDGSFRCDANLSLRVPGSGHMGVRTEIKNLNSFRHVRMALEYEARRQAELLVRGLPVLPETRLFHEASGTTRGMRSKETSSDYRYLPEPDLPDLILDDTLLQRAGEDLPELPWVRRERYRVNLGLSPYEAGVIASRLGLAELLDRVLMEGVSAKLAASWLMTHLLRVWDGDTGEPPVGPGPVAKLLRMIESGRLTDALARRVWEQMLDAGRDPEEVVREEGLEVRQDLEPLVDELLGRFPDQVARYHAGKTGLLGFFVGQAMRETGGRADPTRLKELFRQRLEDLRATPAGG